MQHTTAHKVTHIALIYKDKIHRLCMIMDCEDYTVFTDAMELHYIDMKAFAKAVNDANGITNEDGLFAKWLSVITQKEIINKAIIENACQEEEIFMAVSTLQWQSDDKYTRQAYQCRKDEVYFFNKSMFEKEQAELRAEQTEIENQQLRREIEELRAQLSKM